MTARRLVFLFPGFELLTPALHLRRFEREARRTAATLGMALDFAAPGGDVLDVGAAGEGWRTQTRVVLCGWDDLIARYRTAPLPVRVVRGLAALLDLAVTGTAFRYFRANWRYGLFYLYPVVQIALAILLSWVVARRLPALAGVPAWAGAVAGLLLLALLLGLAARRFHLLLLLDDWAMAVDLARGRNGAAEERVGRFAAEIRGRAAAFPADEVLVAAHSLGVSFAVPALARVLGGGGEAAAGSRPALLTVGSSLLKTALHPAAGRQRRAVAALVETHRVAWLDVQAVADPISFYGKNPAASLGISGGRQPVVRRISFRRLISPEHYRRIRFDLFRTHRQFVYGVERGRAYAFHEILLGPRPFERQMEPQA